MAKKGVKKGNQSKGNKSNTETLAIPIPSPEKVDTDPQDEVEVAVELKKSESISEEPLPLIEIAESTPEATLETSSKPVEADNVEGAVEGLVEGLVEPVVEAVATSPPIKSKKRLTLQERLALAAKGKKKTTSTNTLSTSIGDESKENTPEPQQQEDKLSPSNKSEQLESHQSAQTQAPAPEQITSPSTVASTAASSELVKELDRLKMENSKLSAELVQYKTTDAKGLLAKISAKDDTIKQLLSEGEALSKKELKLNDTIKKLKATNSDLESSLYELSVKDESSQVRLVEIENLLKIHKVSLVDQLLTTMNDLTTKNSDLSILVTEGKHWELKYKEQLELYEKELDTRKQSQRDYNELKIQFDISKKQNLLEMETKNNIVTNLKKDISNLKEENLDEITRLEAKVEQLRMETETSISKTDPATPSSPSALSAPSKKIDYKEFSLLSSNHHNLQQQYLSSQENWKVIESNLMKKVESLNSHAETLKLNKTKTQGEIKKLQLQLNKKSEEVRDYQDKLDTMIKSTEELTLQSELKDNSYKELEERFETFKTIYNNDRSKLNIKIKKLEGELEQAKQQQQQQHVIHQQIQAPPLGADSPSLRRLGSYGFNESPTSNLHRNFGSRENSFVVDSTLSEVKFGESCTTPSISRDASAFYLNGDGDDSEHSFTTENGADGMEAGEDALTYMERNSISHSLNNSNSNNNTNNNSSNNNNHNNNIQLISKMSSNIRRLEIELNTLKSENAHLSNEKELIQQEIIAKIKIEDEIHALREQSLQLIQKLEQKEEKEQTMLEIIGEKTEQVEELKADVVDLKDICRLQVQQMIEMKQN